MDDLFDFSNSNCPYLDLQENIFRNNTGRVLYTKYGKVADMGSIYE